MFHRFFPLVSRAEQHFRRCELRADQEGKPREPFNPTPMGGQFDFVWRTCGGPDEIKKNTYPIYITAFFPWEGLPRVWQRQVLRQRLRRARLPPARLLLDGRVRRAGWSTPPPQWGSIRFRPPARPPARCTPVGRMRVCAYVWASWCCQEKYPPVNKLPLFFLCRGQAGRWRVDARTADVVSAIMIYCSMCGLLLDVARIR